MKFKISFKKFKDVADACDFATLVHENLINLTCSRNGEWHVIYKELTN